MSANQTSGMTKRHYVWLAAHLRTAREEARSTFMFDEGVLDPSTDDLRAGNPRFDADRFRAAVRGED